ncbi:MAG: hypothetical protein M3R27_05075 [Bacteroidota bacterium]|nr:hypothetical protein [Bacteroidota bacterium]
MKTQITTLSKYKSILKCCIILFIIAVIVTMTAQIDVKDCIDNFKNTISYFKSPNL